MHGVSKVFVDLLNQGIGLVQQIVTVSKGGNLEDWA